MTDRRLIMWDESLDELVAKIADHYHNDMMQEGYMPISKTSGTITPNRSAVIAWSLKQMADTVETKEAD